ncbi:YacL family protein [Sneathiella limimaris]|uniref:YacL family protein n=1 Tax=Sneathiella limimaris TaxID=1964213 RepID=UPI00146DE67D|nr:YacL family protein [Sneathiella limimaris]
MNYEILKDEETGLYRLEIDAAFNVLKSYLESEIQQDMVLCKLLQNRISSASLSSFNLSGNLYDITLKQAKITISNQFDETDSLTLDSEAFLKLLEDWSKFVTQGSQTTT